MNRQPNSITGVGKERPAELDVLDRYVAVWLNDVTIFPSKTDPVQTKTSFTEATDWTVGKSFVMSRMVNPTKGTKQLWFFALDREDRKKYPFWYFDSEGNIELWSGRWDEGSTTMTLSTNDYPEWTGNATHVFSADGSYFGNLKFTDDAGYVIVHLRGNKTKQPASVGNKMLEIWNKSDTPSIPLPEQLKELDPFVGQWESEFIHNPSIVSPNGETSKGTVTAEWILDGRVLFFNSQFRDHESRSIVTYDPTKRAYRDVHITNTGRLDESAGQWNEATRSFFWNLVNAPAGITRTSTYRIVGADAIEAHVLAKNKDGAVQMDLTIKLSRRTSQSGCPSR